MFASLLIALREGVEAALVVGIVLLYLARTGRKRLARAVWIGVVLAVLVSGGVAELLDRWQVNQDGFEGLLMIPAAVFVVSMIVWMNRAARHLRKDIEQKIEGFTSREGWVAGLGVGTFVFLMVVREGVELALILRAVEFSTASLEGGIGTGLGLAIVKHVLTRHQARLDIRSEMGRGSTFSAVFPPQRIAPLDAAKAAA